MIENDEEFKEAFKEYFKIKGIEKNGFIGCVDLGCKNCIFKDVGYVSDDFCSAEPFQKIEEYEEKIELLKQEIEIMKKWKEENDVLTKEARDEVEETYHTIQNLTAKMFRLYKELDQMKNGEQE